jgi:Holliday junction resolvase RusA-like endonuclease
MNSATAIKFAIPAIPVAQPRQRHNARGHSYIPSSHPVHSFKATARLAAEQAYQGPPLEGALYVHVVFVMPRPQAMCWKRKPTPREWHTGRPDADNLAKSVWDACNGILWRDDSQIAVCRVEKVIAAGDEQPRVEIQIQAI